jgi:hypothetical protein
MFHTTAGTEESAVEWLTSHGVDPESLTRHRTPGTAIQEAALSRPAVRLAPSPTTAPSALPFDFVSRDRHPRPGR